MTPTIRTTRTFTDHLDWSIGLYKAGLRDRHIHVLGTLVEVLDVTGGLAEGETTVQMSRYEIAQRTSLSTQQVQRALTDLVEAGYIVRAQLTKKDGEISRTLLTSKAVEAMGLKGGANLEGSAPPELVALLIGESKAVIDAVIQCWNEGTLASPAMGGEFRGGAKAWAQIEFLLAARMEAHQTAVGEAQAALQEAREAEQRGEYVLSLPDGASVALVASPFRDATNTPAQRSVDIRFVRDTLSHLAARHPAMVTRERLPALVAEIAFSRSAGFVFRHDAGAAVRILASCVSRPTWSRPRGIDKAWYTLAARALRQGDQQGDRF